VTEGTSSKEKPFMGERYARKRKKIENAQKPAQYRHEERLLWP